MKKSENSPIGYRPWLGVRQLLKTVATSQGRSMNSQLNHYVAQGLKADGYIKNLDQLGISEEVRQ